MVMADDDEDSENDCLYIDESPTEPDNQGSTSQNPMKNVPTKNTRNELPKNSAEVPLLEKVNVVKNIPNDITDIPNDQTLEAEKKARISCKPFSRKPFVAKEIPPFLMSVNEIKEGSNTNEKIQRSALYHYLTTDDAVPPEYTGIPNEGNQNPLNLELKQLLVAPSRPPTMPYPPIATVTPYQRSCLQSNPKDPRIPPLTDVQNGKHLPHIQANQTSVIVPHPGIPAGGTITLGPTSDQQANNIPTTLRVNGYPIQNGQPSQFNSDANIRQKYSQNTETGTEFIGQTSMTNLGGMPYRICELNCPCRKGGPMPTSPLNPEPTGRSRGLNNKPLVNSQNLPKKPGRGRPRKTAVNPPSTGRKVSVDIPFLNTHPPNPALNSYCNGRTGETIEKPPLNKQLINPDVNPDRRGMTVGLLDMPSLSPQPINPNLNGNTVPMETLFLNPNLNGRTEEPMDTSPLNPNHNDKTGGPMGMPHLNPNLKGRTEGPVRIPHLNPNLKSRKEGPMDIPPQQMNPVLNPYLNGRAGRPMDVPHLNPNFNGRTGRPMPHLHSYSPINPVFNHNVRTEGPMDMPPNLNSRTEGLMNMPHLYPHPSMNPVSNLDVHGRTGGPMDMPPDLNGMTEGPMNIPNLHPHPSMNPVSNLDLHGRTEGTMNMPHLHPHPSINPVSNLDLHEMPGGPMDMPPVNGRTEGPMNMPHVQPHPSMNPVSNLNLHGRTGGPMDTPAQFHQHLNPHLPINSERPMDMSHFNPNFNGREGGYLDMHHLNLVHESMNPTSSPQHQPIHPLILQEYAMNLYLLQQHQSMSLSMSPHQPMNPFLRVTEEREGDPIILSFNTQHQTINSPLNHQYDARKEGSMNMPPFSPSQPQKINPLNSQPVHNSRLPPCYQCATGMRCEHRLALSHTIPQKERSMTNPQTVPQNYNGQASNIKDYMPHHPAYSNEEIKKANYLASLRSTVLETATRDILSPSVQINNTPGLNTTANLRAARVNSLNNDAGIARRPACNDPTCNDVYTPAQPYVSPPRTYPIPNWAALRTHHTVTKKGPVKTVTKTTKANILTTKTDQEIPVSLSTGQTLPLTINAEIPHIDLTVDLIQNTNTNITPNIMPVLLNTETQQETVNMRIDTTQTNITTTALNINTINLMQVPQGEDQSRQMNVNNNGSLTHLMEISAHHGTLPDDINKAQTKTEKPWINIESDGKQIPLIMDEEDMSIKNHFETTIQPNVIKVTDTIAQSVQNEAFVQKISNDIDVEAAVAQLHANTDENITNVTQTSKTPVQSTKAYELVSTTSVTSETMSQDIKSNNISKPGVFNSEANTTLRVSRKQIIENTVTVAVVKQIVTNPNISLPETDTLVDILNKLNKAKPCSTKPWSSIDQTDNSKLVSFNDNIYTKEEKAQTREGMELTRNEDEINANISLLHIIRKVKQIPTKTCLNIDQTDNSTIGNFNDNNMSVGDGNKKGMSHETKEPCDSKDDKKFKIARQNLARLRVTTDSENENERVVVNTQLDTDNKYQIKIRTCASKYCISQVQMPSFKGSCVEPEEFHINCSNGNAAENNQRETTDQEINDVDEPHENTNNENTHVSNSSIDEMIFFKFQINFFRLVQERLSENNHEEFANKVHNDILNLITVSEDDDAKADMAYECHECHNVTLYSPRQLYYYGNEVLKVNTQYCQLCITFRRKYIEVLIKYITLETSLGNVNNQITEKTKHNNLTDNTATEINNKRQAYSATTLNNDADDNLNKHMKNEKQGLVTDEVLTCSKQAETGDQENHYKKNMPNSQNQTNSFMVKLPLNMLKESTVKKLMQCIRAKFNNNESGENFNVTMQDNNGKGNNNLSNPGEGTSKETIQGNRNIIKTLTNNKDKHCTSTKGHNAETLSSESPESQKINTNNLSTNIEASDRNKERHSNNRRSGIENAPDSNLPTNRNTITSSNSVNINDSNENSHSKKKKGVCDKSTFGANPETQNINNTYVSPNRDCSNMNQERRSKKRKSIGAESAPTANPDFNNKNTSTKTNITNDQVKSQEKQSKKRKSISARIETVKDPDAEKQISNSTPKNRNDNDKNQERYSKRRIISSAEAAPSEIPELHNRNVYNASDNNENNCERRAKKRRSISTEIPTIADTHDRHDNCKNKQKDLGAKISRCGEMTTTEDKGNCDKDTPSKNNKVHKTKQLRTSKSKETATSNDADSLKKKTMTISNNNNSNRNEKQPLNSEKNKEANNNEIRKSVDAETTPNKTKQQLNVQDNTPNNNKDNDTNPAAPEFRKSTSADILNKIETTPSSNATSTDQTNNNASQNPNKETAEQNDVSKNNDGDKQNNIDTRKDNEKAENTANHNHTTDKVKDVDACKKSNNKKQNTRKDDENEEEEGDDEICTKVFQKAMEDCFKKLKACGDSNKNEILGNLFKTLSENLYSKESDDLPEVKITGKQEKKSQKGQVKISYKYLCDHCSVSFRSLDACRSHVTNDHKKAKIVAKDCIEVRKCQYCTDRYVQPKLYDKHIKTHHKDIHFQIIKDE